MAQAALSEILAAARFDAPAVAGIRGEDPVLPVRYRVGTAGAASLAALGLAVDALWELRGGARQRVEVDLRAATVSLRSARYLHVNGKPPPSPWDPLSGFYPVREGWISIHCNFPNHREAAMGVLGAATREAGEQASREWQGDALEEAIHAAGGCAGLVRSRAQWAKHAQAVSGIAQAHGDASKPRLLPVSAIDYVSGYLMAFGATLALARRAREGGSWLVRVALARTGKWIVDLGEPKRPWAGLPEDLPKAELDALMGEMDAPDGRIRYLKPVLQLSQTPPHWTRPPVPLGTHPPTWS